jgi:cytochrome c-type biogenesis protein CcsB
MCYTPAMHVLLLRVALGLYSIGLLHSVLTVLKKKHTLFTPALYAVTAGLVCHTLSIILRAVEVQYLPLTQRYESFSFFAALTALGFLLAYAKYRMAPLSVFAFPVIFVATFIANLFYDPTSVIPNALRSNWIYIHTPLIFLGYAALFLSFSAAVMYLIQERELKTKHAPIFFNRLPSLEICDDLAYKSLAIGFPLITLGIVSGALWAQAAWGSIWGGDLKVLLSFVTWLIYLLLIHYRLIAGWRGKKAAYLAIVGFIGVLVTFLGANYFGGLHTDNFSQ